MKKYCPRPTAKSVVFLAALLFWEEGDDFDADVKLLFDEMIIYHLDIESIMFLSESLTNRLKSNT
ncbi:MAG: DUF3786 domain-containing protein [Desulfamplus sp.]|nr:DUF3786 domain-containing protein [Desulfamplus sp.]